MAGGVTRARLARLWYHLRMERKGHRSRPPPRPRSGAHLKRPLVLVVDDIVDNREMYLEYLRYAGFRVAGAVDGETAVELARTLRPTLILMDLSLPGIDGWEATRTLKSDPVTRDILVVALTGHAEPACEARAMLAGCDLFLAKPSTPQDVADHVARLTASATRGRSKSKP